MQRMLVGLCVWVILANQAVARVNPHAQLEHLKVRSAAEFGAADERRFNELVDEVVDHFQDTVRAQGGTLVKDVDWDSTIVNATANVISNTWTIMAFGGLYRVEGMTDDAFQLAICHEAGHLMGGYPNYGGSVKATSEGQADYFAAQVCARKVWGAQVFTNQAAFDAAPTFVQENCLAHWSDAADAQLCTRIAVSAEHLIAVLSTGATLSLASPDQRAANATIYSGYPTPQCRIDTYYSGARCAAVWDFALIPGRGLPLNGVEAEAEAHRYSCHRAAQPTAARPACWYNQRVD